jgi:hypothetical protein
MREPACNRRQGGSLETYRSVRLRLAHSRHCRRTRAELVIGNLLDAAKIYVRQERPEIQVFPSSKFTGCGPPLESLGTFGPLSNIVQTLSVKRGYRLKRMACHEDFLDRYCGCPSSLGARCTLVEVEIVFLAG